MKKYEQILVKLSKFEEEKKALVNETKALNNELPRTTNKLQEIMKCQDDMEQYIRRECLEICGIPCLNDQENTNSIIKDIAKEINVDITDTNMSPSHLLKSNVSYKGKSKNSPPIIVKFT
jgi:predicted nuclease with TOPRIM domain